MNLVNVTPLSQTTGKEELSYFTDLDLSLGSIVSVDIRNKVTPALVVGKESVSDAKTRIKSGSYKLKKINNILTKSLYSADVIEAAQATSEFYAVSLGGILKASTPKAVLDKPPDIKKDKKKTINEMKPEAMVLQVSREDRITFYKQYIRGSLARGRGVFICVPTKKDVEYIADRLKKGIEHATFSLHGSMSVKATREAWEKISDKEAKLIVSTSLFLSAIDGSFDTLILEREASDSYYTTKRPFFNLGFFARMLAQKTGVKFIAADSVLSVETYREYEDEKFSEAGSVQKSYREGAEVSVIDMTGLEEEKNPLLPFLSSTLLESLKRSTSGHSFVYTARRGLAPTTTCSDCGYTFFCPKCFSPTVLHGKEKKRLFICHTCGYSHEPRDKCPKCKSWRLTQLGIGSERVVGLLEKAFPKREVLRMDSDNTGTVKKEEMIWSKFKNTPGSILVGTEMAVNKIRSDNIEIQTTAIASIDSLLTYPNYSSGEKVFRVLMEMALTTERNMIIQTRAPEQRLLSDIKRKNVFKFFEEELDIRKKLFYPPFSIPITVTFSGNKFKLEEKEKILECIFASHQPIFFRSISERVRGQRVKKMLLRSPRLEWPDEKIVEGLKSLPPEYKVAVHPPTIV